MKALDGRFGALPFAAFGPLTVRLPFPGSFFVPVLLTFVAVPFMVDPYFLARFFATFLTVFFATFFVAFFATFFVAVFFPNSATVVLLVDTSQFKSVRLQRLHFVQSERPEVLIQLQRRELCAG